MNRNSYKIIYLIFAVFLLFNHTALSASFNESLIKIREEINRDDLNEAINKLKKITVSSELEQENINILFGDIYLKINQPQKAEEFYNESLFTSDDKIEALTFAGLADVRLLQGKLDDAVKYSEKSISINPNLIRPKIILAIAKTRLGESKEAYKILNDLYYIKKNAEVSLALANYFIAFDEKDKAISILEDYLSSDPKNMKVVDQLANFYLMNDDEDKSLEYKFRVFKYYEFNKNKKKLKETKSWILSIDPNYFDKPTKVRKKRKNENKEYQEQEINSYQNNQVVTNYEKFKFACTGWGSGFIVGKGKYVITNYHVINGAKKIAVRNGLGKIRNAKVVDFSEKYDLAILELDKNYHHKISLKSKTFKNPMPGEDVVTIGFPGIGETAWQPTITQGIVSKVFTDDDLYPGTFMTTISINGGNSGGPIFDLNGNLLGVAYASLDKLGWIKAALKEELKIPTDMGYAIQSRMINKIFEYKQNKKFKNKKYSRAELYQKMLPSVVIVHVSHK